MGHMQEWTINTDYPWISPTCIESKSKYSDTCILNQRCILSRKASIGMYSGCDKLSLQILFVYFLTLPSLLPSSILLFFFYTCAIYSAISPVNSQGLVWGYNGSTYNMSFKGICVSQSILQQIFRSQKSSVEALNFPIMT